MKFKMADMISTFLFFTIDVTHKKTIFFYTFTYFCKLQGSGNTELETS